MKACLSMGPKSLYLTTRTTESRWDRRGRSFIASVHQPDCKLQDASRVANPEVEFPDRRRRVVHGCAVIQFPVRRTSRRRCPTIESGNGQCGGGLIGSNCPRVGGLFL